MTKQQRDEIRERMLLGEQTPEDVDAVFQAIRETIDRACDDMIHSLTVIAIKCKAREFKST